MMLGIDEMPITRIANGIQNHTAPTAPPVIIDALGTRPIARLCGGRTSAGSRATAGPGSVTASMSVTAAMHSNLGTRARR